MGEKIYTLRIDEDIFNKVKEASETNRRSIAKEIEHILASHFQEAPNFEQTYNSPEVDKLMTRLVQLMSEYGAISGKMIPPSNNK